MIEYKDGSRYSVQDPNVEIWGIMNKEKVLNFIGSLVVTDLNNQIECEVKYNPNNMKVGMLTKIPGFGNSKAKRQLPEVEKKRDFITLDIQEASSKSKNLIKQGRGSWLSWIEFDDEEVWNIDMPPKHFEIPQHATLLESDSSLRKDAIEIGAKNFEVAETEKVALEQLQRADKKLRETA